MPVRSRTLDDRSWGRTPVTRIRVSSYRRLKGNPSTSCHREDQHLRERGPYQAANLLVPCIRTPIPWEVIWV